MFSEGFLLNLRRKEKNWEKGQDDFLQDRTI
jgi:hypothetical protein